MILTSKCVYTAEIYMTKLMNSYDWYQMSIAITKEGFREAWPSVSMEVDKVNCCVSVSSSNQLITEGAGNQLEAHLKELGYV